MLLPVRQADTRVVCSSGSTELRNAIDRGDCFPFITVYITLIFLSFRLNATGLEQYPNYCTERCFYDTLVSRLETQTTSKKVYWVRQQ